METPSPFDLDLTVRSHGFYDLPPWAYQVERSIVSRPLRVASGRVVEVEVAPGVGPSLALRVFAAGRLAAAEAAEVRAQVRTCLALDEDLRPFYRRIGELEMGTPWTRARLPALAWAAARGAGRLLRSPSVFEDAIKTLCTTNCTWALTRAMVKNLVERLGDPGRAAAGPSPRRRRWHGGRSGSSGRRSGPGTARVRSAGSLARWHRASSTWRRGAPRASPRTTCGSASWRCRASGRMPPSTCCGSSATTTTSRSTPGPEPRSRGSGEKGASRRMPPSRGGMRPYGVYAGLAMWLELTADWHGVTPGRG